jgi:hypothetical protein
MAPHDTIIYSDLCIGHERAGVPLLLFLFPKECFESVMSDLGPSFASAQSAIRSPDYVDNTP